MSSREDFEKIMGDWPYELSLERWPNTPEFAWPGQYQDGKVQLAWDFYQAGQSSAVRKCVEICEKRVEKESGYYHAKRACLQLVADFHAAFPEVFKGEAG